MNQVSDLFPLIIYSLTDSQCETNSIILQCRHSQRRWRFCTRSSTSHAGLSSTHQGERSPDARATIERRLYLQPHEEHVCWKGLGEECTSDSRTPPSPIHSDPSHQQQNRTSRGNTVHTQNPIPVHTKSLQLYSLSPPISSTPCIRNHLQWLCWSYSGSNGPWSTIRGLRTRTIVYSDIKNPSPRWLSHPTSWESDGENHYECCI